AAGGWGGLSGGMPGSRLADDRGGAGGGTGGGVAGGSAGVCAVYIGVDRAAQGSAGHAARPAEPAGVAVADGTVCGGRSVLPQDLAELCGRGGRALRAAATGSAGGADRGGRAAGSGAPGGDVGADGREPAGAGAVAAPGAARDAA